MGSLVPGFAFVVALVPALVLPIYALTRFLQGMPPSASFVPSNVKEVISIFRWEIVITTVIVSYIAGRIFFLQRPNIPDSVSWNRIRADYQNGPVRDQFPNVEFPYFHLYEFLNQRGMHHLKRYVKWKGDDVSTHRFRTKHLINALKIRVEFSFPNRYGTIARNEAHVRLTTTSWYLNCALIRVAKFGFCTGLLSALLPYPQFPIPYAWAVIAPVSVWFLASRANVKIEKVLHYQRVREVVFVLETAHWAERFDPGILQGLYDDSNESKAS